jgi:hypothetical protein
MTCNEALETINGPLNRQALVICEVTKKLGNNEIDTLIGRFGNWR